VPALALLEEQGFETGDLRSKSWDEFSVEGAPEMDMIITVCDNAAGETCPIWPGQPMTAHWGIEDPAAVEGNGQSQAFWQAYQAMQRRIQLFLALPIADIDEMSLQHSLKEIGKTSDAESALG